MVILSLLFGVAFCLFLPPKYLSSALILVEDQKVPKNYVRPIQVGTLSERFMLMKQQIMSRSVLAKVVAQFHPYPEMNGKHADQEAISELRKNISVETIGAGSGGQRGNFEAFRVSFVHEIPEVAQRVTDRIASLFIEENLKVREQLVEGTTEFLANEREKIRLALEKQEKDLSRYRQRFMGELPDQLDSNLRALDRLQRGQDSLTDQVENYSQRLAMAQKALAEYQVSGSLSPEIAIQLGRSAPLIRHLNDLEKKLLYLSAEYTDTYPDVRRIKFEIEQIKKRLTEEYGERVDQGEDPGLQALKNEIAHLEQKHMKLELQEKAVGEKIKEYERRVDQTPIRQQELLVLRRDYENTKNSYRSLLTKQQESRVTENLERLEKGERFRIIESANLPGTPSFPNKLRIMLMALAVGCAAGYGSAFALDQWNPAFRRDEEVELVLQAPILASIPDFKFAYGNKFVAMASGYGALQRSARLLRVGTSKRLSVYGNAGSPAYGKPQNGKSQLPPELNFVTKHCPWSAVAEQFRVAASRLTILEAKRTSCVVLVTSAVMGEGKTATVINLGYTLARALAKRTLILDCDFKAPTLHKYMQVDNDLGMPELLRGEAILDECLQQVPSVPLWVVPGGNLDEQSIELSEFKGLHEILNECRQRFEYILIDSPPVLPLADVSLLAGLADRIVMVVKAGSTPRETSLKALHEMNVEVALSIILNGVWEDKVPYYIRALPDPYMRKPVADRM